MPPNPIPLNQSKGVGEPSHQTLPPFTKGGQGRSTARPKPAGDCVARWPPPCIPPFEEGGQIRTPSINRSRTPCPGAPVSQPAAKASRAYRRHDDDQRVSAGFHACPTTRRRERGRPRAIGPNPGRGRKGGTLQNARPENLHVVRSACPFAAPSRNGPRDRSGPPAGCSRSCTWRSSSAPSSRRPTGSGSERRLGHDNAPGDPKSFRCDTFFPELPIFRERVNKVTLGELPTGTSKAWIVPDGIGDMDWLRDCWHPSGKMGPLRLTEFGQVEIVTLLTRLNWPGDSKKTVSP